MNKEKWKAPFIKMANYFKDVGRELKKVVWPTKRQLFNNTVSVLMVCLIIGSIIWVFDFVVRRLIEVFITL